MEDFEIDDIEFNEEDLKEQKINQLSKEIAQLRAQLNIPPAIAKTIGGAAIGQGLGLGPLGMAAIGFLGYQLGKGKEIDPKTKQALQAKLQDKARQLLELQRGEELEQAKISGVMGAAELIEYKYDSYNFDGKWKDLMGCPAKSFHCMVFGRPKNGKSIWSFQFANYLTRFGKVLYIAAEEGFSATLQQKLAEFGGVSDNMYFANYRNFEQIREALKQNNYEFVVIDSINFINLEPEDVEILKSENKKTAFITIQQATKGGQFRGSQQFAHNCDIIIEVIEGVAHHTGRYAAPSEMQIFDNPQFKSKKVGNNSSPSQISLFEEDTF
jgi:hypothetical protein